MLSAQFFSGFKMTLLAVLFGLFQVCCGYKVYDWQRDWGSVPATMEMAQIQDGDRQILHSSLGMFVDNTAAISMHDFNYTSKKFKKGIVAIRPILSPGTQLCFVTKVTNTWKYATSTLEKRHKATVARDGTATFVLQKNLPEKLDPLSIPSVAEFCDVDKSRIYYIKSTDSLATVETTVKIQGLFSRYHIGIPDKYVAAIMVIS